MKVVLAKHLISCAEGAPALQHDIGIVIQDGRITQMAPIDSLKELLAAPGTEVIDPGESYVMPGLIDAHLHLCFDSTDNPITALDSESADVTLLRMAAAAQTELRSGVTTVRDCGAKGNSIFHLRDQIRAGVLEGPDIIACGAPITVTGGHSHFLGLEVDSLDEVEKAVRQLCKDGADFIKVMVSGGNMTPGSNSLINQYGYEALSIITREAHARGKRVAGHIHTTVGIQNAVRAGFDTIEHCSFKDSTGRQDVDFSMDLVKEIRDHGISVCPAFGKGYILPPEEGAPLPDKVAMWAAFQNSRFFTTEQMFDAGINVAAGTDAGCKRTFFHEFPLTLEILHSKVHMPIYDVLLSATIRAAKALDIETMTGSLEVGKNADLIFVSDDPTKDLQALRKLRGVIKGGNVVFLHA